MVEKWTDVIQKPEYMDLNDEEKSYLKNDYWENVVTKNPDYSKLNEAEQAYLSNDFFGKTLRLVPQNEIKINPMAVGQPMPPQLNVEQEQQSPPLIQQYQGAESVYGQPLVEKTPLMQGLEQQGQQEQQQLNEDARIGGVGEELQGEPVADRLGQIQAILQDPNAPDDLKMEAQAEYNKFEEFQRAEQYESKREEIEQAKYGEKPLGIKVSKKIADLVTRGGFNKLLDPKEQATYEGEGLAEQITLFATELGGELLLAKKVAGALSKTKRIQNINNLAGKMATIRAVTGGTIGGSRNLIDYIAGDKPLSEALKDTGVNIGATLFGMIPENLVRPGIINLVSQVGGDVAFDVVTDLARGKVDLETLKKADYWKEKGLNNVSGVFFAWSDYKNRKGSFKVQQETFKSGVTPKPKQPKGKSNGIGIVPKETVEINKTLEGINKEFRGIKRSMGRTFASAGTKEEIGVKTPLRKYLAENQQRKDQMWTVGQKTRKMWENDFTKEQGMDFIDNIEKGLTSPKDMIGIGKNPKTATQLSDLAKTYRFRLDVGHELEKTYNDKASYIENYFPHIWEDAPKAEKYFTDYVRNLKSKPGFMKQRTIDFIKQGLEHGLKLKTSNPEEIVLLREFASEKFKMQRGFLDEMKSKGLMKFHGGGKVPEGWTKLDDKTMDIYFKGDQGIIKAGSWIMPEDGANIVNNYLSTSLWNKEGVTGSLFRVLMKAKNTLVPIRLAISGFHMTETLLSDTANSLSVAFKKSLRGDFKGALTTAVKAPLDPIMDIAKRGKDNINAWYNGAKTDAEKTAVETMIRGGFRPKMSEVFRAGRWDDVKKAWWEGDHMKAVVKTFPALVDWMAKPIMDIAVPRLKAMSYLRSSEDFLKANPDMPAEKQDVELQKISANMDNRFGQMQYDNLFWKRMYRDLGVASTLSLGWNLGTIRDFGGATIDTLKAGTELGKKLIGKESKIEITDKMTFIPMYVLTVGTIGGIMTYMMTGKKPENMLDYFYPATGRTNPDGSKERRLIPAMTKDAFSLKEAIRKLGVLKGIGKFATNKLSPIIHDMISFFVTNKNYFGVDLRDKEAPFLTQAKQISEAFLKANMPFSFQSYAREKAIHGKGSVMPFLGFGLAPGYITKTPMQKEIYDLFGKRFGREKTYKKGQELGAKRELRNLWRNKKRNEFKKKAKEYLDARLLRPRQVTYIQRNANVPPDLTIFRMLPKDDKNRLIKKMSDKEKDKYLRGKYERK